MHPEVRLIAHTVFADPGFYPEWETDADNDAAALVEYAGRTCFRSFGPGKQRSTRNQEYIDNILAQQHMSVIEHVNITVAIRGVSRSLTHELVRHRHFSFSELSQRFVSSKDTDLIEPPSIERLPNDNRGCDEVGDPRPTILEEARDVIDYADQAAQYAYGKLTGLLTVYAPEGLSRTDARKYARQAARCVLPNATATEIVVTGNLRAWCCFLKRRATKAADMEMRRLAVAVWQEIKGVCPQVLEKFCLRAESPWGQYLETEVDFE